MAHARPPTGLDHLSAELLHLVCAKLSDQCHPSTGSKHVWDNQRALLALSQTSRTFRFIAQPLAYRTIVCVPRNAVKLLRTLEERTDLAECVRVLYQPLHDLVVWKTDEETALIESVFKKLQMNGLYSDGEFEAVASGMIPSTRFYVQLLIGLLPNVARLRMYVDDETDPGQVGFSSLPARFTRLQKKEKHDDHLPKLRLLEFAARDDTGFHFSDYQVGAMLRAAQGLEKLVLRGTKGIQYMQIGSDMGYSIFPPLPNLKSLELEECALEDDSWSEFFLQTLSMNSAPGLSHFRFTFRVLTFREFQRQFSVPRFLTSLSGAEENPGWKDTLTSLDIDLTACMQCKWPNQRGLISPEALHEFTRLKTLKLDECCLCSYYDVSDTDRTPSDATCLLARVPVTLETFCVRVTTGPGSHVWRDLETLCSHQGKFSTLKRVTAMCIQREGEGEGTYGEEDSLFREIRDEMVCRMKEAEKEFVVEYSLRPRESNSARIGEE